MNKVTLKNICDRRINYYEKPSFEDFITTVDGAQAGFVTELHRELIEGGCTMEWRKPFRMPLFVNG